MIAPPSSPAARISRSPTVLLPAAIAAGDLGAGPPRPSISRIHATSGSAKSSATSSRKRRSVMSPFFQFFAYPRLGLFPEALDIGDPARLGGGLQIVDRSEVERLEQRPRAFRPEMPGMRVASTMASGTSSDSSSSSERFPVRTISPILPARSSPISGSSDRSSPPPPPCSRPTGSGRGWCRRRCDRRGPGTGWRPAPPAGRRHGRTWPRFRCYGPASPPLSLSSASWRRRPRPAPRRLPRRIVELRAGIGPGHHVIGPPAYAGCHATAAAFDLLGRFLSGPVFQRARQHEGPALERVALSRHGVGRDPGGEQPGRSPRRSSPQKRRRRRFRRSPRRSRRYPRSPPRRLPVSASSVPKACASRRAASRPTCLIPSATRNRSSGTSRRSWIAS